MPLSALKKATIETMSITPRNDGKVEIALRVVSEHAALIECAAQFISAGVNSFDMLEVFRAVAPRHQDDFALRPKATIVSPDVLPLNGESRVAVLRPVNVDHVRDVSIERSATNDNREAELRGSPYLGELSIHDLATLMGLLENIRQEVLKNRELLVEHERLVEKRLHNLKRA